MLNDYGFELVEYKEFGEYYNDFKNDKHTNIKIPELSEAERDFSFLNTTFCFKKIKATPDKEYKALQKAMNKK